MLIQQTNNLIVSFQGKVLLRQFLAERCDKDRLSVERRGPWLG